MKTYLILVEIYYIFSVTETMQQFSIICEIQNIQFIIYNLLEVRTNQTYFNPVKPKSFFLKGREHTLKSFVISDNNKKV